MRASTSNITAAVPTVVGAARGSPGEQQSAAVAEALRPVLEQYSQNELDAELSLF